MQVQAPKGQYRVIGLDPIDTLTSPSGPLWKDCETFQEARDLADAIETCTSGSTYTMTLASFCTRQAPTPASFKGFKS